MLSVSPFRSISFAAGTVVLVAANQMAVSQTLDAETLKQLSELKAIQSRECLKKGDRICAISKALEGLPANFTEQDIADRPAAYEALYWAVRSRSIVLPVIHSVHTSFTYQGTRIATVSMQLGANQREPLKLWNAKTGELVRELLPSEKAGTISSTLGPLSFSRNGKLALHTDPVRQIPIVWDAETGEVVRELPILPGREPEMTVAPKVQLSRNGTYALITHSARTTAYEISGGKQVWSGKGTMAASISPDERQVAIAEALRGKRGGESEVIRFELFELSSKKPKVQLDIAEKTWGAYSAIFSEDGQKVAVTTSSDALLIIDIPSLTHVRISTPRPGMGGANFSPDSRYIALTPDDWSSTEPAVFDVATGQRVSLPMDERPALDSVFSQSGEEVGPPWYPDAGDIWRRGVTGPALYDAAKAALAER